MANDLKSRYNKLADEERRPYLDRAELAAKLTIPSLIPDESHNKDTAFDSPWQSIGARGTNNLSSKFLLALFPPGNQFFRMKVDEVELEKMDQGTRGDIEKGLAAYERVLSADIENAMARSSTFQAFKHLIVAGNALLFNLPNGGMRMYPLSRFTIKRDTEGNTYEIITKDMTVWGALAPDVAELLVNSGLADGRGENEDLELYTGVTRGAKEWKVWQEIEGIPIPDSVGTYPLDATPWIPLRMVAIDGESYGRSYVEEIYGDLNTADALTQAITEGAAASAIVKFLVDPNGSTDVDDLVEADNGGFVEGREQDISVLQVNKFADLRVASEHLSSITSRLQFAFLMNSSVQRDAERVTAEEVRFMAQELEDALGGIYSILAQELQLPLVTYRMAKLQKTRKLPPLPKSIQPEIITGLEALGRSHEHARLRAFVGDIGQTFGPEAAAEYVVVDEYAKRSGAAMNIEPTGLVRTSQEVTDNRNARAQAEAQIQAQAAAQAQTGE